jgi:hypothetical protein
MKAPSPSEKPSGTSAPSAPDQRSMKLQGATVIYYDQIIISPLLRDITRASFRLPSPRDWSPVLSASRTELVNAREKDLRAPCTRAALDEAASNTPSLGARMVRIDGAVCRPAASAPPWIPWPEAQTCATDLPCRLKFTAPDQSCKRIEDSPAEWSSQHRTGQTQSGCV